MPSPPRLTSLPLDITGITAGLFSLSVELQPLRTADEVTALLVALRRYPRDLPHRDEKIVQHLGGKYSSTQIKDLVDRLDAASPAFMQLSSSLPFAGDDKIFLVCPVDNCVACAHAPPLVVKTRTVPSSPTVVTESGLFGGVVHQKVCGCCGATHGLSYAEGGTAIPAGKQLPYAHATARSTRFVHLQKGYVFENSLLYGYEAQALFSHTGYEPWAEEYRWKTGCDGVTTQVLRQALAHAWLPWSLLRWLDELGIPLAPVGLSVSDGSLDATLLEHLRRDDGLHQRTEAAVGRPSGTRQSRRARSPSGRAARTAPRRAPPPRTRSPGRRARSAARPRAHRAPAPAAAHDARTCCRRAPTRR